MTLDQARAILDAPGDHTDTQIRDAAHLLMQHGTLADITRARGFVSFGLPRKQATP
jgi:hypothetical protein